MPFQILILQNTLCGVSLQSLGSRGNLCVSMPRERATLDFRGPSLLSKGCVLSCQSSALLRRSSLSDSWETPLTKLMAFIFSCCLSHQAALGIGAAVPSASPRKLAGHRARSHTATPAARCSHEYSRHMQRKDPRPSRPLIKGSPC